MARPNFVEKTFAGDSKTAKFVKVFSLESFPLYGNRYREYIIVLDQVISHVILNQSPPLASVVVG